MAKLNIFSALIMLIMALSLVSFAFGNDGTATFYTSPYVPSACDGYTNDGVMIGAASDVFWNNKGACGQHYKVKCTGATNEGPHPCTGKTVIIRIVDYCPNCQGTIDLSQEAFKIIANPDAGKIKIRYDQL